MFTKYLLGLQRRASLAAMLSVSIANFNVVQLSLLVRLHRGPIQPAIFYPTRMGTRKLILLVLCMATSIAGQLKTVLFSIACDLGGYLDQPVLRHQTTLGLQKPLCEKEIGLLVRVIPRQSRQHQFRVAECRRVAESRGSVFAHLR